MRRSISLGKEEKGKYSIDEDYFSKKKTLSAEKVGPLYIHIYVLHIKRARSLGQHANDINDGRNSSSNEQDGSKDNKT